MFILAAQEKAEVVAHCDHLAKLKFSKALPFVFTALCGSGIEGELGKRGRIVRRLGWRFCLLVLAVGAVVEQP